MTRHGENSRPTNRESPGFIGLFRRSRYHRRIADDDDSEDAAAERFERERFAAAAVGFCLKHSATFRAHFWKRICRLSTDPETPPPLTVEVEPVHWADIRLSGEIAGKRCVWVVECKVGAPLDSKQNPCDDTFFVPSLGYGWLFKNSEDGSNLRYVVLGARESLGLNEAGEDIGGITVTQSLWSSLRGAKSLDSLQADLLDSLGHLGISCFRMAHIESIRVKSGFQEAAAAWEVLTALGSEDGCGFRTSYWRIAAGQPEPEVIYVGASLRRPPPLKPTSNLHRALDQRLKPPGDKLTWVGYEAGPNWFRRSVWFYCATKADTEVIAATVTKRIGDATPTFERDGSWCAVISSGSDSKTGDLAWFRSVLNAAIA